MSDILFMVLFSVCSRSEVHVPTHQERHRTYTQRYVRRLTEASRRSFYIFDLIFVQIDFLTNAEQDFHYH